MIRIIDNTLSGLNELPTKEELHAFCQLLFVIGVDMVEVSIPVYKKMECLPWQNKCILAIDYVEQMDQYPGFYRYVCRHEERVDHVMNELQLNDMREIVKLRALDYCSELRIVGLDDMLCKPYEKIMGEIKRTLAKSKINFCPENTFGCASALAVQWILNGGYDITTSFAGFCNNAATEEVLMALRLSIRHKPNKDLTVLPQVTQLFEQISNRKIGNKKPIIGKGIFKVEAGIHADGIIKNPATYEAYDPKSVGGQTEVVIGKHSGLKAIKYKLIELNMPLPSDLVLEEILHHVKVICHETKTSLADEEFKILAFEVIAYEREQIYC